MGNSEYLGIVAPGYSNLNGTHEVSEISPNKVGACLDSYYQICDPIPELILDSAAVEHSPLLDRLAHSSRITQSSSSQLAQATYCFKDKALAGSFSKNSSKAKPLTIYGYMKQQRKIRNYNSRI